MGRKSDEITEMIDSKGTEKAQERLSFLIVDSGSQEQVSSDPSKLLSSGPQT